MSKSTVPLRHPGRFYIGGEWVEPSTSAMIDVVNPATEEIYFQIAEAREADMSRAIGSARSAFDEGPWPRMSYVERAGYLRRLGAELGKRRVDVGEIFPREVGALHSTALGVADAGAFGYYADMAESYPFIEELKPSWGGEAGLLVHEPVGVVGAIVPWNVPMGMLVWKMAPALLAGCTLIVKSSPEAPGEGYIAAEAVEAAGFPAGVVNFVTADREVSELLVRDPRVDKISFTGSTAAGRRIGSILGERVARFTLELGGKSAAVVLSDADIPAVAAELGTHILNLSGQFCGALSRIVVVDEHHDAMVEALAGQLSKVRVGDPFDPRAQMGPLATSRRRDRVEGYIAKGIAEGAALAVGGGRPTDFDRGWYVEPTVFSDVDNSSTIAQEEIFGPVLSVIRAADEADAVRIANDSIYGLNASVYTQDVDHALAVARRLQSGTVGHNAYRGDFTLAFGGFKQSGVGREGGTIGLRPFLETKTVIMNEWPAGHGR